MFVFVSVITTLKCWFTPLDTLQTYIDTILIINRFYEKDAM